MPGLELILHAALLAHLPSISFDDYGFHDEAFFHDEVDKNIVLFDHVSCEVPEVWITFETTEPDQEVFVQLGVPVIDRLADYHPAVALLAPGLPEIELPFPVPEGVGGLRYDAADTDTPGDFYEPFTDTHSWIWFEDTITVPDPGQAWVVAWDPTRETGKLWVAIGTVEDFSDGIGVTFEQIWSYHETSGHEPDPVPEEMMCELDGEDSGEEAGDLDEDSGDEAEDGEDDLSIVDGEGCACSGATPEPGPGPLALAALALLGLSRRRR